jgi:CubicO group peptidase (beta-lactamase class C family)
LPRAPGAQWEYSNLGVGLLGHILAARAGMSYEQLLRSRILEPLGMKSTTITLSADQRNRLASGYGFAQAPMSGWDFDALAGAGAIRSTANDMLTFAAAFLDLTDHPLKAAMKRMLTVNRPSGLPGMRQRLGWLSIQDIVLFHDGETGGYRSALAIRLNTRQAVIVLSNSTQDVSDIAIHGVVPENPLLTLEAQRQCKEIQLGAQTLQTYVGDYDASPQISIAITREQGRLYYTLAAEKTKYELCAEQENVFAFKAEPDASVTFVKDTTGAITQLTVRANGAAVTAARRKSAGG